MTILHCDVSGGTSLHFQITVEGMGGTLTFARFPRLSEGPILELPA